MFSAQQPQSTAGCMRQGTLLSASSSAEHRNMPQADAMVLVARNYERYKTESREKEREEIARQAAKMADEAVLQERDRPPPLEEGVRGGHPPGIQTLLNLLADNRYLTAEETDKVINYLRERKERLLRGSSEPLQGEWWHSELAQESSPGSTGQWWVPCASPPLAGMQSCLESQDNSGLVCITVASLREPQVCPGWFGCCGRGNNSTMVCGLPRAMQLSWWRGGCPSMPVSWVPVSCISFGAPLRPLAEL